MSQKNQICPISFTLSANRDQISFADSHHKLGLELDLVLPCDCTKDGYLAFCLPYRYNSTVSRFWGAVRRKEQKKHLRASQSKAFVQCRDWWSVGGEPNRYRSLRWLSDILNGKTMGETTYLQNTRCRVKMSIWFMSWRVYIAVIAYKDGTRAFHH